MGDTMISSTLAVQQATHEQRCMAARWVATMGSSALRATGNTTGSCTLQPPMGDTTGQQPHDGVTGNTTGSIAWWSRQGDTSGQQTMAVQWATPRAAAQWQRDGQRPWGSQRTAGATGSQTTAAHRRTPMGSSAQRRERGDTNGQPAHEARDGQSDQQRREQAADHRQRYMGGMTGSSATLCATGDADGAATHGGATGKHGRSAAHGGMMGQCDGQQRMMVQWAMRWVAAHDGVTGDVTGSVAVVVTANGGVPRKCATMVAKS